jgi:hypothetical protein
MSEYLKNFDRLQWLETRLNKSISQLFPMSGGFGEAIMTIHPLSVIDDRRLSVIVFSTL